MKVAKLILFPIVVLIVSVISFFAFTLICTIISNYAALTSVALAPLPMVLFMCLLITFVLAGYYVLIKDRKDPYFVRKYAIVAGSLSLVGIIMSIITGTLVYGSFFKEYVFDAYPFIMLLAHLIFLGISITYIVTSTKIIKAGGANETYKPSKHHAGKTFGMVLLLTYALTRVGAFILTPIFWSKEASPITIPYIIQLLVPALIIVGYVGYKDYSMNKKAFVIYNAALVGYSVLSLIYIICITAGRSHIVLPALSGYQLLERLVKFPVSFAAMYIVSIVVPLAFALPKLTGMIKESKSK